MPPVTAKIRKTLLARLLVAWLLLSILVGAVVYLIELRRVDDFVKDLAINESRPFAQEYGKYLNRDEPSHRRLLREQSEKHIKMGHFVAVALYNKARQKITEVTRPDFDDKVMDRHPLFQANGVEYRTFFVDGQIAIHLLLPLRNGGEEPLGYFEGLYQADRETMSTIQARITSALVQIVVVLLAATLTVYPIILALNKDLIRLSVDLSQANIGMLKVLGNAVAKRDSETNAHNYRVTLYAIRFAETIGLGGDSIRSLIKGSFLHDVGKIGISDTILLKPGKLSKEEFEIMKLHTRHGEDIIGRYAWLNDAMDVVRYHHEKFDGSGYGTGIKDKEIPLSARIFSIVDVFDALTSRRPYKEPLPFDETMKIIREESGTHFDPQLVDVFEGIARNLFATIGSTADEDVEKDLDFLLTRYFEV